jgi:hypothetical protein
MLGPIVKFDIDALVKDIKSKREKYETRKFVNIDPNTACYDLELFLETIIKQKVDVDLYFYGGIQPNTVTKRLVTLMKRANVKGLNLPRELNRQLNTRLKKKYTEDDFYNAIKLFENEKFDLSTLHCPFPVALRDDNLAHILSIIKEIKDMGAIAEIAPISYIPGTPEYDNHYDLLKGKDLEALNWALWPTLDSVEKIQGYSLIYNMACNYHFVAPWSIEVNAKDENGARTGGVHTRGQDCRNPSDLTLEALLRNQKKDRIQPYAKKTFRQHPVKASLSKITEKSPLTGNYLLELITSLNANYKFERSFKMAEKKIRGDRFTLIVYKSKIRQNPYERLSDICKRMDMPEDLFEAFSENLPDAEGIGFGFEENEETRIYKVYIDFLTKWEKEIERGRNEHDPFPAILGFKWDALDNSKCAQATYTWYPSLSFDKVFERLSSILGSDEHRTVLEMAKDIIDMAFSRMTHDQIRYSEETETTSQRERFDLSVYKANLPLKRIYPLLKRIYQHYSIPPDTFHGLYNPIRTQIVGHLSGGIDREGKDFLTIYYGLETISSTKKIFK